MQPGTQFTQRVHRGSVVAKTVLVVFSHRDLGLNCFIETHLSLTGVTSNTKRLTVAYMGSESVEKHSLKV